MHKHFAVAVIGNTTAFMIGITLTFNEVFTCYITTNIVTFNATAPSHQIHWNIENLRTMGSEIHKLLAMRVICYGWEKSMHIRGCYVQSFAPWLYQLNCLFLYFDRQRVRVSPSYFTSFSYPCMPGWWTKVLMSIYRSHTQLIIRAPKKTRVTGVTTS